ncbi:heme biosynthesis protein HemY [Mariprofundus erugo]|uniref:tetratricopeptide repeat protein n=1 Tax=Mariprofundus erugo TaxID=2528639 RepID=UPI0010FF1459|nr:heme biosynthesis protein HemY [Mariprofundus erugo]TLS77647.1 heme biosynthesis protein HemY [Mariprofundus erugo]
MRLVFLLVLALAVCVVLLAFPDIADQTLRLEAFGWIFETRQGTFMIALFIILLLVWLARSLVVAVLSGPGHIWQSLRLGSSNRRERRLQEAIARWLNGNGDLDPRLLKRSKGIFPEWAIEMLAVISTPARELPAPDADKGSLLTALTARMATSMLADFKPDLAVRKAHLRAWLQSSPNAALARARMADVLEEEENWPELVTLLEESWKKGQQSAAATKPRLVHAYLKFAESVPEQAPAILRKAYRLNPDDGKLLLAYGQAEIADGKSVNATRLWLNHLQFRDDMAIARALLLLLQQDEPMKNYRKLERKGSAGISHSLRWMRAELAASVKLDGLAREQMQLLADEADYPAAWESLGRWYEAAGEYQAAASCLNRALARAVGQQLS